MKEQASDMTQPEYIQMEPAQIMGKKMHDMVEASGLNQMTQET